MWAIDLGSEPSQIDQLKINKMKKRVGVFLVIVGLIMLVVFFTIDQSEKSLPVLFFSALASVFLGVVVYWRNREPPMPSERFRSVRKVFQERQNPKK
jgi:hypothetical protein